VYSAAIIGCGNIAGRLDSKEDEKIITHAHAFYANPKTTLNAFCDSNTEQLEAFAALWNSESATAFSSLDAMLSGNTFDIISICTPTPSHAPIIKTLLEQCSAKVLLCEKPFVSTLNELETLRTLIGGSNTKIIINFLRRFDPSLNEAKKRLKKGKYGKILGFSGRFTKGLYHNGSHMLELIENLIGPIELFQALDYIACDDDYTGTFYLSTPRANGTVQNSDGSTYALFELDIVCEEGRIRITESGHDISCYELRPSERYKGYTALTPAENLPDTMAHNMLHTVEYAVNLLEDDKSETVLNDHLRISEKLLQIKESLGKGSTTLTWTCAAMENR